MTWPCRLIEWTGETKKADLRVGDMFFAPHYADDVGYWPFIYSREKLLSDYYKTWNSERRPILMWMPGQFVLCLDAMWGSPKGLYGGHIVTGDAPKITLNEEIIFADVYRGTLVDGVLSEDLNGRKYRDNGECATTTSS